jgi:hypothetical protein
MKLHLSYILLYTVFSISYPRLQDVIVQVILSEKCYTNIRQLTTVTLLQSFQSMYVAATKNFTILMFYHTVKIK